MLKYSRWAVRCPGIGILRTNKCVTVWRTWGENDKRVKMQKFYHLMLSQWISWCAYFKLFYFRKFDNLSGSLTNAELSKIERVTNCKTPCNYNEYKLANNPPREFTDFGNEMAFGLMAISENTEFQEEVQVRLWLNWLHKNGLMMK